MAESVFVELRATITEFQAKMAEAREEMSKTSEAGSSKFSALSKAGGMVMSGLGGVAVGVAGLAIKMGNDLEDARARLETALKASGTSFDELAGPISNAQKSMESFGFSNAQTEDALSAGVVATGSASKALGLLQTAANLAAFKHISLADAMTAVSKASEGNLRPLKQLGIDLPVVASSSLKVQQAQDALKKAQDGVTAVLTKFPDAANRASKAHAQYEAALGKVSSAQDKLSKLTASGGQIMDALNQKLSGQAASAADTFSGKMEVAKTKTEDMLAALGVKLIPVIETAVSKFADLVGWLGKHKDIAYALAGVIGGVLTVSVVAWAASAAAAFGGSVLGALRGLMLGFKSLTSAELDADAAAEANPFGAIVLAVTALGVGIYELVTHWKQVWGFIKETAGETWAVIDRDFVKPVFGFFGGIVGWVKDHWQLIVGVLTGPIGFAIAEIITHWNGFIGFFEAIPGAIARTAVHMWDSIADAFKGMVNFVIGLWNTVSEHTKISIPKVHIPLVGDVGGGSIGPILPAIPYLEKGGLVTKTGLIYAHAGEAVSPLPKGIMGSPAGPTGDLVIQVDGQEFARITGQHFRKWMLQSPGRNAVRGRLTS